MRTEGKCVAVMETCAKGLRQEKECCFQHDGPGDKLISGLNTESRNRSTRIPCQFNRGKKDFFKQNLRYVD